MSDTGTQTKAKPGGSSETDAGAQQVVELSPTTLTWLGEEGDAKPNKKLMIVKTKEGKWRLRESAQTDDQVVVPGILITTPPEMWAAKEHITKVVCTPTQGKDVELSSNDDFDAVFWTPSSVRKFVWPYYQSHRLWDDDLQAIKDKFETDPAALAIAHQAPSRASAQVASPAASLMVGRVQVVESVATFEFVSALKYI